MIEHRIYRAALVPAFLALALLMFSLEREPAAVPQGLPADVLFDGRTAGDGLDAIARRHPDRRPESAGNRALADDVDRALRDRGFATFRDRFSSDGRDLANVVARRPGASRDQIVVMAGRDSAGGPDRSGTAADTAALLEIARVLEGRPSNQSLVLVSLDGASLGAAGARRFAETAPDRERIRAAIVISSFGARRARGPLALTWSNDDLRGSFGLERTARDSLRLEGAGTGGVESAAGQLSRLAFPLAIGAQGVLAERGIEAVRLSGSGELPPPEASMEAPPADRVRLGRLGRATLRLVTALDAGEPPEHGPDSYLATARKLVPGWAIALLALALILPPLVTAVDGFARARRRREPMLRWGRWALLAALPFGAALAAAELLVVAGQAPDSPPAPPLPPGSGPGAEPLDGDAAAALGVTLLAALLAWGLLRALSARRGASGSDPAAPGAGCAVALVITVATLVVWFLNPYAALLLAPAANLWSIAALAELRSRAALALMVAGGLVLPAIAAVLMLDRLAIDPLEGTWYLFQLVTGHHIGLPTALIGCLLLGSLTAVVSIGAARTRVGQTGDPELPRLRGPGGYAGPGSLGGTESALRR